MYSLKIIFLVIIANISSEIVLSQSCKDSADMDLIELVLGSPIVVQVSVTEINRKEMRHNATAKTLRIFDTRHGNFTENSTFQFGPVGKSKGCVSVKVGKSYILFLNNQSSAGFHWISFNPIRSKSKTVRTLHKLLRHNGLTAPSFKKSSKVFKKQEGKRLKIKCKASGKPIPKITWYYNGKVLNNNTAGEDIIVKKRKKGGSGSIEIKHLDKKYDDSKFICSASNPVSPTAVNFTNFVTISKHLSGRACSKLCDKDDETYCFDGQCCLHDSGTPYCRCYFGWIGSRCDTKDHSVIQPRKPDDYRHMQRLIAVLGMCLALMLVVFLCFAVYCFFKRSRSGMHQKLLQATEQHTTSVMKLRNDSDGCNYMLANVNTTSTFTATDGINLSNSTNKQRSINAVAIKETVDLNHKVLEMKLSRGSGHGGSKRSRLNGLAINHSSPQNPAKRLVSSRDNSPLSSPVYKLRHIPNGENQAHSPDFPSPYVGRDRPVIPVDNAVLNIVNHQSNPSSLTNSPRVIRKIKLEERKKPELVEMSPQCSSSGSNKNHTVTTFSPSGYVKKESFDRGDAPLSLVTSHSSLASPQSTRSNTSKPLSVPGDGDTLFQQDSNESCNPNYNNNSNFDKPEDAKTPLMSTSDQDDLFSGVDIPDTSLGLYSQQSLERNRMYRQNAVTTDNDYAYPTVINATSTIPVASAELLQVPLLSDEDHYRGNVGSESSTMSLSSNVSNFESSSDTDSHKIVV